MMSPTDKFYCRRREGGLQSRFGRSWSRPWRRSEVCC
ncbi:rCG23723 [Rattus norvegicus]|uniref:RCG23723 n=1 Tax=Rattus norvegicus TaxID=10116 RepID=A6JW52_RAT|nr:rCG23723 [Rattus norvegicus]